MSHNHRNLGAHEDVNTEFGGLPHVRVDAVMEEGGGGGAGGEGFLLCVVCCVCVTAGRGATEVHWMLRPGAGLFSIANLLRVACFLFSVCLEPFYYTQSSVIKAPIRDGFLC